MAYQDTNLATVDLGNPNRSPVSQPSAAPPSPATFPDAFAKAQTYATSAPAPSGSIDPKTFQTAINQMRTKMESNNKLINAKNAVFKHMYDQPLTDTEKGALTPSLAHAISTGNRSLIDAAISDVNNQIKGYNSTVDTNLAAYSTAVQQANSLKQDITKSALDYIAKGVPQEQVAGMMRAMGLSESDIQGMTTNPDGMRTDRNMNPTAMTTDVAKQAGLIEGVDYAQGDPFTTASGQTLYTAKFIGDPIKTTIKAIDNAGFFTQDGKQRWNYIAMSQEQWNSLTPDQKTNVVKEMYKHEGGNGTAIGMSPAQSSSMIGVDTSQFNPNALNGLTSAQTAQIQAIATYRNAPMNRSTAQGGKIMGLVDQYNPNYDSNKYAQVGKAVTSFAPGGKDYQNIKSLNTATGHLQTLKEKADSLNNGGFQVWNAIKNYGLTATGDPRVANFNNAVNAVSGEMATIFKNTSGTDQEIKSWKEQISAAESPEQLQGAISTLVELMGSRLEAISGTYEQAMGTKLPMNVLSDKSQKILQDFGVEPSYYLGGSDNQSAQVNSSDPLGLFN